MKDDMSKTRVSRRNFLGTTAAAAAAVAVIPLGSGCTAEITPMATGVGIPNSNFGGVPVGTITYSFRGIESGMEGIIKACTEAGISNLELMSQGIEQWCGAPEQPSMFGGGMMMGAAPGGMPGGMPGGAAPGGAAPGGVPQGAPGGAAPGGMPQGAPGGAAPGGMPQGAPGGSAPGGMPQGAPGGAAPGGMPQGGGMPGGMPGGFGGMQQMTEEERAAQQKEREEAAARLKEWRLAAPMEKFAELKKLFDDAGISIHIVKFEPSRLSDEEIDYMFKAAKALGAKGVSEELSDSACQKLGPIAEKNGMYAVFHNHMQFAQADFDVDKLLAYSPANMLNFDCGHYFGSTGKSPVEFIEKYHDRIFSIHLKDKTGPNTTPANANQVWGQGETPLAEVLLLVKQHIKEEGWPKYCDIELEYTIPAWSDSVREVRKCVNYARGILV